LVTKLPCLWTRSKFISTVGSVSLEVVKKYIEDQKMCKNKQISESLKETRLRRSSQSAAVFEVKIIENKISKKTKEKINRLFLKAKWLYNYCLSQEDVFDIDTKIKQVECKTPEGFED